MIEDILFDLTTFIMEIPTGIPGGDIVSYSMDGHSYNFTTTSSGPSETSSIFIN